MSNCRQFRSKNGDGGCVLWRADTFTIQDTTGVELLEVEFTMETLWPLIDALLVVQREWDAQERAWLAEQLIAKQATPAVGREAGRYVCGSGDAAHWRDAFCPRENEEEGR